MRNKDVSFNKEHRCRKRAWRNSARNILAQLLTPWSKPHLFALPEPHIDPPKIAQSTDFTHRHNLGFGIGIYLS